MGCANLLHAGSGPWIIQNCELLTLLHNTMLFCNMSTIHYNSVIQEYKKILTYNSAIQSKTITLYIYNITAADYSVLLNLRRLWLLGSN